MQLTLLCGADPKHCARGPSVRLQAGRWKLQCEGIKDSSLYLTLESNKETISVQHDAEFVLEIPGIVWLDFRNRGRENYITVNAQRVA